MKDQKHSPRHTREIDADKLLTASKIELQIDNSSFEDAIKNNDKANYQVEATDEIQEDLMHIIEKLSEFGNKLKIITSRIDKIEEITGNNYRNHQIEIDLLRRDLLGERKTFVYQSVIKSIIASVDSLYNRKRNLTPEKDDLLLNQATGILDNLQNLLKSIGYESFIVNEGEIFSTENMECMGFDEGEENKVVHVERLGFKTEYHVMRPCGVIIGRSVII
jgi:molecular chaperone GrpE (heat shock protein)